MRRNILKDTKGLVAVIVALLITVLLGFTAFVVDIGSVAMQRQNLQKAADAAALAGAQDLPSAGNAISTAISYLDKNGVKAPDTYIATTPYSGDSTKIEVKCTRTVSYTFAQVFGYTQTNVSARAVAQKTNLGAAFDYVIFSGNKWPGPPNLPVKLQNKLNMTASSNTVNGNVHGNYDVNTYGNKINGNVEAVGIVEGTNINHMIPGAPYIPMPDFSYVVPSIKAQAIAAGQYYTGNFSIANASSLNITQPVYVEGDANLSGISFSGVGCIYAGGKIKISGSSTSYVTGSSICIYSGYTSSNKSDAAIDFSGSDKSFKGILFAPNGSILVSGSNYTFTGSVVGTVVDVSGSNKTFQSADVSDCFPASSIILTE